MTADPLTSRLIDTHPNARQADLSPNLGIATNGWLGIGNRYTLLADCLGRRSPSLHPCSKGMATASPAIVVGAPPEQQAKSECIKCMSLSKRPHAVRVSRFFQTLCREWAYGMPFQPSEERKPWLPCYLVVHNQRRCHMVPGGLSPQHR